jgi:hypothetical protein
MNATTNLPETDHYFTAQVNEVLGRLEVPAVRPLRLVDRATLRRLVGRASGRHAA